MELRVKFISALSTMVTMVIFIVFLADEITVKYIGNELVFKHQDLH